MLQFSRQYGGAECEYGQGPLADARQSRFRLQRIGPPLVSTTCSVLGRRAVFTGCSILMLRAGYRIRIWIAEAGYGPDVGSLYSSGSIAGGCQIAAPL
jgi:hypothetical protein